MMVLPPKFSLSYDVIIPNHKQKKKCKLQKKGIWCVQLKAITSTIPHSTISTEAIIPQKKDYKTSNSLLERNYISL